MKTKPAMTAAKKPRPRKARTVVRWVNYYQKNYKNGTHRGWFGALKGKSKKPPLHPFNNEVTCTEVKVTISLPLRGDKK